MPQGVFKAQHIDPAFTPYDPAKMLANLSPTTPRASRGKQCSMAMLLAVASRAIP
ncbi:MAG: hypothetical protein WDM79_02280 [Terricaulis sp.]